MFRIIKFLFYVCITIVVLLAAFAYLGPLLGFDFSPPLGIIEIPLELTTE